MIETLRPDWPHQQHVLVVDGKPGQGASSWEVFMATPWEARRNPDHLGSSNRCSFARCAPPGRAAVAGTARQLAREHRLQAEEVQLQADRTTAEAQAQVVEARQEQLQAGRRPREASSAGARRRSCTGGRRRSTPTRVRGTTAAEVGAGHQCGVDPTT
jgi:hypothetical protein